MSQNEFNTYDSKDNNCSAALVAGTELADAGSRITDVEGIPFAIVPNSMKLQSLENYLDAAEKRAEAPKRRKGTAVHQELGSFIAHLNRFKDPDSAVWADGDKVRLEAVLNYHTAGAAGGARWGDHCSTYECPLSVPWKTWMGRNEKPMTQDEFGQFIEDNMVDLASPDVNAVPADADLPAPAKVLEVARNLVVRTKGEFSRSVNITTGEASLTCKVENESSTTKIPRAFLLKLPVFDGGVLYRVEARMRFWMQDAKPKFMYALYQPHMIVRDAFNEVRREVEAKTGLPVFAGKPE